MTTRMELDLRSAAEPRDRVLNLPFQDPSTIVKTVLTLAALTAALGSIPASAEEASWHDRFQIFGHVTTAYADFKLDQERPLFVEEATLGIPEDGTWDYRTAALQVRFQAADRHRFVLQLSHRSFDDSLLEPLTDEVEVDWLFWEWRLAAETRLRVGRFATPAGIFNEFRDVGTLLPFFRPSFNFYREGSIFSETVDGIGLSHRFFADSAWPLDADVYYGEFEVLEQTSGLGAVLVEVDADDALGGQLWLGTPVPGLRFGVGGLVWDVDEASQLNPREEQWQSWYLSVDAAFDRWVLRTEYRRVDIPIDLPPVFADGEAETESYYGQVGWRATEKLSFWIQSESTDIVQNHPTVVGGSFKTRNRRDDGVAVNYAFRPDLVLKAEYHEQELEALGLAVIPTPSGFAFDIFTRPFTSEYTIVSLAYSF